MHTFHKEVGTCAVAEIVKNVTKFTEKYIIPLDGIDEYRLHRLWTNLILPVLGGKCYKGESADSWNVIHQQKQRLNQNDYEDRDSGDRRGCKTRISGDEIEIEGRMGKQ